MNFYHLNFKITIENLDLISYLQADISMKKRTIKTDFNKHHDHVNKIFRLFFTFFFKFYDNFLLLLCKK